MDLGIAGKRALVCAASRGLGKAAASALAGEGVELFLCARDTEALRSAAGEIERACGRTVYYQSADLSDPQSRLALIAGVEAVFPGVDILIHNVGGPKSSSAEETSLEDWQAGFQQLFQSVVHLNQAFLPGMKENRWGRILAVTSLSVMEPIPALAISNAMRAAVTNMLKTLADEVAKANVCVNCVAPGHIFTDRTEERLRMQMERTGVSREKLLGEWTAAVPAGRMGDPREFGAVVAFLCSQQASYITGSTICVDGGRRRSAF